SASHHLDRKFLSSLNELSVFRPGVRELSGLFAETEELAEEAAAVAAVGEQELVELAAVEVDPFAGGALFHLDTLDFLRHHLAAAFGALAPVGEPARLFFGALPFL